MGHVPPQQNLTTGLYLNSYTGGLSQLSKEIRSLYVELGRVLGGVNTFEPNVLGRVFGDKAYWGTGG